MDKSPPPLSLAGARLDAPDGGPLERVDANAARPGSRERQSLRVAFGLDREPRRGRHGEAVRGDEATGRAATVGLRCHDLPRGYPECFSQGDRVHPGRPGRIGSSVTTSGDRATAMHPSLAAPCVARRPMGIAAVVALAVLVIGCSTDRSVETTNVAANPTPPLLELRDDVAPGAPEDEGLDSGLLVALTERIRDQHIPMFSFLISRNGRLVYELYTSSLTRDHAHYQMSATKSVVSALIGVAIDRRLISGPNAPITETLPRHLFASDADVARFRSVTVRHVLGMSALDAPDPPRVTTPEAVARQRKFWSAHNRVKFALEQPVLATPGREYQYNDVTPMLAVGLIQYATGRSALEFAEDSLFGPMGFRNYEWMHQDPSGIDLGGYGLRLRPIDMQKFGVLYLNGGVWRGHVLISRSWVEQSFSPWNRSRADAREPNYGWFWWAYGGSGWAAHVANGWKVQRIAVLPRQKLVVTMTACIEDGSENRLFNDLIDRFVVPSVRGNTPRRGDPATQSRLTALLEQVRTGPSRVAPGLTNRMIPSISPKERHVPFKNQP